MKKIFKLLVLSGILGMGSLSALPTGVFIGANIGTNLNKTSAVATSNGQVVSGEWRFTFQGDYGVRLGFIWGINNYNAFKITGTYDYSNVSDWAFMQAGASLDYMLSFSDKPNASGVFIGGGYDWGFYDFADVIQPIVDMNKGHKNLPYAQFGFFKAFGETGKAMMQFGIKYPFGQYTSLSGNIDNLSFKTSISNVFQLFFAFNYTF